MSVSAGYRPVSRVCCPTGASRRRPVPELVRSALSSRVTATAPRSEHQVFQTADRLGWVSSRSCNQVTANQPNLSSSLLFQVVDADASRLEGTVSYQVPVQRCVGANALYYQLVQCLAHAGQGDVPSLAKGNHLGDQRIVKRRHRIAIVKMGVARVLPGPPGAWNVVTLPGDGKKF